MLPPLQFGFANAWLLVVSYLVLVSLISRRAGGLTVWPDYTPREKRVLHALTVGMVIFVLYTIFTPLRTELVWLVPGLAVYGLGVAMVLAASVAFLRAEEDALVTAGLFRYSRNPIYLGYLLIYLGVGIATLSAVVFVYAGFYLFAINVLVGAEERGCRLRFGAAYDDYCDRVRRWC